MLRTEHAPCSSHPTCPLAGQVNDPYRYKCITMDEDIYYSPSTNYVAIWALFGSSIVGVLASVLFSVSLVYPIITRSDISSSIYYVIACLALCNLGSASAFLGSASLILSYHLSLTSVDTNGTMVESLPTLLDADIVCRITGGAIQFFALGNILLEMHISVTLLSTVVCIGSRFHQTIDRALWKLLTSAIVCCVAVVALLAGLDALGWSDSLCWITPENRWAWWGVYYIPLFFVCFFSITTMIIVKCRTGALLRIDTGLAVSDDGTTAINSTGMHVHQQLTRRLGWFLLTYCTIACIKFILRLLGTFATSNPSMALIRNLMDPLYGLVNSLVYAHGVNTRTTARDAMRGVSLSGRSAMSRSSSAPSCDNVVCEPSSCPTRLVPFGNI